MLSVAFYGKGGIGKSTTCSNIAIALSQMGRCVLQIGCDPKADSTRSLHPGQTLIPLLSRFQQKLPTGIDDVLFRNEQGIYCLEAGGPVPGLGCAGRGIGMVLEFVQSNNILERLGIDCVLYDVLGDVVCGGFSMPMRKGYARHVLIITSGETMSLYAARNIAEAVRNFRGRGYAQLGGLVMMEKNFGDSPEDERRFVEEAACELNAPLLATIPQSPLVEKASREGVCVSLKYPDSEIAARYRSLAETMTARFDEDLCRT